MILGRRWAAPAFWAVSVLLALGAAVGGARWGLAQAPSFEGDDNNGAPATSASHFIYSVFGAAICGFAMLALASGVFFLLWARQRRADGAVAGGQRFEDDMDFDEVGGMLTADDEDPFEDRPTSPGPR